MFGTMLWLVRAFILGLAVGLLTAPRAGRETRRLLRGMLVGMLEASSELLALPSEPIELPDRRTDRERAATAV